ncbi:MAG: hypothetical protein V1856_00245 [Candidatus Liptonbacteria bacterium]
MRFFVIVILSVFLAFLVIQIWNHNEGIESAKAELEELRAGVDKAKNDYRKIQEDFEYYSDPVNLEKELRARFNYRAADEKMIIIVPTSSVKTQSSTP